jgi:hypothetical protein
MQSNNIVFPHQQDILAFYVQRYAGCSIPYAPELYAITRFQLHGENVAFLVA